MDSLNVHVLHIKNYIIWLFKKMLCKFYYSYCLDVQFTFETSKLIYIFDKSSSVFSILFAQRSIKFGL